MIQFSLSPLAKLNHRSTTDVPACSDLELKSRLNAMRNKTVGASWAILNPPASAIKCASQRGPSMVPAWPDVGVAVLDSA